VELGSIHSPFDTKILKKVEELNKFIQKNLQIESFRKTRFSTYILIN
jgi:hypothetical protein